MKKNSVLQYPGIRDEVMESMKENARKRKIPETGYHGFIVFDEMSIQVRMIQILGSLFICELSMLHWYTFLYSN